MEAEQNNLDRLIKQYLESKISHTEAMSLSSCPSELELCDYLQNRLTQEKKHLLSEHIANCPRCLSLLKLAQESREGKIEDRPTPEMIIRAQNIVRRRPQRTIFNYKWQICAGLSFTLSFVFTRYFLQFLILAVIFSLKWIFDTGSTRTLVMIYEAWRRKDKGSAQRIIQGFRDKLEERK